MVWRPSLEANHKKTNHGNRLPFGPAKPRTAPPSWLLQQTGAWRAPIPILLPVFPRSPGPCRPGDGLRILMIRLPGTMTRIADCCNCLSSLAPVTEGPAWSAEKPLRPFGGAGTREAVAAAHPAGIVFTPAPQPAAPRSNPLPPGPENCYYGSSPGPKEACRGIFPVLSGGNLRVWETWSSRSGCS